MLKDADKRLSRLNRNKIHLIPALAYPSEPDRLDAYETVAAFRLPYAACHAQVVGTLL